MGGWTRSCLPVAAPIHSSPKPPVSTPRPSSRSAARPEPWPRDEGRQPGLSVRLDLLAQPSRMSWSLTRRWRDRPADVPQGQQLRTPWPLRRLHHLVFEGRLGEVALAPYAGRPADRIAEAIATDQLTVTEIVARLNVDEAEGEVKTDSVRTASDAAQSRPLHSDRPIGGGCREPVASAVVVRSHSVAQSVALPVVGDFEAVA